MEGSLKELAGYRLERAREMLLASENNLKIGEYRTSLNRSYYAVFHAMRSANALKGFAVLEALRPWLVKQCHESCLQNLPARGIIYGGNGRNFLL